MWAAARRRAFAGPPVADLTRYRKRLIQAHGAECQRIQKTLEDAGIKLDSVATDVLGVSGRAMLEALVAGERAPGPGGAGQGQAAQEAPPAAPGAAGRFGEHHALLVGLALDHLATIAALDGRIDEVIAPAAARDRLDTITGVGKRAAEVIIAEIGVDMTVFPTVRAPGVGTSRPGNNITGASVAQASPPRATAGWPTLTECAWAAARSRDTLPGRSVLAAGRAHRQEEGRGRRGPLHPGDLLVPAGWRLRLPRPWRRLLHPA